MSDRHDWNARIVERDQRQREQATPGALPIQVRQLRARMEGRVAAAMTTPDTDGWVPWVETDSGSLKAPDLGDLSDGKTIESRYEYDGERLYKAWSRKLIGTVTAGSHGAEEQS